MSKGPTDSVHASKKLYNAVKECIKLLAQLYRLPEYEKAKRGRWWTELLNKAARRALERGGFLSPGLLMCELEHTMSMSGASTRQNTKSKTLEKIYNTLNGYVKNF